MINFIVLLKPIRLNSAPHAKLFKVATLFFCFPLVLAGCSFQKYESRPIKPSENLAKFEQKDPTSKQFQQYLLNNGYRAEDLPLQKWGLDELTYCALFFHPSLDVARAQWRAVQLGETLAKTHPLPILNGNIAHSNDPEKKPFAFGFSIDIPIETANKRNLRIENAQHLSQASKLEIAQTAWQLRDNIAQTLTELQLNQSELGLLTEEHSRRQEIVHMIQKRVAAGAASNVELSNANIQLQAANSSLNAEHQKTIVLLSKLASNIGLPLAKVESMSLEKTDMRQLQPTPSQDLQATALLNRIDIRIALERYAVAEAKLKLEIAKQYPDIVISPGAAFEFGDNIWSLGVSGLLTFLNKNKLGIADATQLREVEAAQFEALQTKVILDATVANTHVNQARRDLENRKQMLLQQQSHTQRMQRKFSAGEIDRLEMTYSTIENINAEKSVALANFQLNKSLDQLESILQKPLVQNSLTEKKMSDAVIKTKGEK